jgi:hypothetical protein
LTSRLQSFETEVLTQEENLAGLAALNRELIAKAEAIDSPRRVVLDMDSTEIPGQYDCSAPLRLRRLLTPRLRSSSTVMAGVVGPPPF